MPSPHLAHLALACATLCGWASLLILAVVPDGAWPHTGARGNIERAAMFFAMAAITRATITEHQTRWQLVVLASAAAVFEVARGRMAGRSNGVAGWMSSTAGAVAGAILIRHVAHTWFWRWGW